MEVKLYARVSTEDQNIQQQVDFLKEWFTKQGHKIVKVIADEESGRKCLIDRKKFNRLLKNSVEHNFHGAIGVLNLDRLTRNWDDVTLIEKYFRDNWNNIKLISTSDSIDLGNSSGRLMFRIKMAVGCYTPEDMREKQVIGIERAKKEGKYQGGAKGRKWK